MSRNNLFLKTLLTAVVCLTLPLSLVGCQKAPLANGVKTTDDPTGKIASSPLTVLSIAGGNVLVLKPGAKDWVKGEEGMTLGVDYKVKTANGNATLTFFEGSTIELKADTEIGLAELSTVGTVNNIKLKETIGETISRVKKLTDSASTYEIETQAAVAAVRGTTMYVAVNASGITTVGNVEGSAFVIVQGIETFITPGFHLTVEPGKPAGQQQPGAIPGTTTAATTTTQSTPVTVSSIRTTATTTTTSTTRPVIQTTAVAIPPSIAVSSSVSPQTVFRGDTITLNFTVTNNGTIPVSGVTVSDQAAGTANYTGGDKNSNNILDPGEVWTYKANYIVPGNAPDVLNTIATVSWKGPDNQPAQATVSTLINVTPLTIVITSPGPNTQLAANITLAGTVNDSAITQVTVNQNGSTSTVRAVNGNFTTTITLAMGTNTITVTATRSAGISTSVSITIDQTQ
jgi:hypothetical protein